MTHSRLFVVAFALFPERKGQRELTILHRVRRVQSAPFSPLSEMWKMRYENGSSLPVAELCKSSGIGRLWRRQK